MEKSSSAKSFYVWIMVALVVWGGLVALGSFLGPEFWAPQDAAAVAGAGEQPVKALVAPFDIRKPLVVMASVGLFLGCWALALRSRQKRLQRAGQEGDASPAQARH